MFTLGTGITSVIKNEFFDEILRVSLTCEHNDEFWNIFQNYFKKDTFRDYEYTYT